MRAQTIAVFEDDDVLRELLRDVLEGDQQVVVVCASPWELHQAALRGATLAITDTWGPSHLTLEHEEREQIEAVARLLPTILISGRTWTAHASARELGLVALLPKPFDMDDLLEQVHICGRPRNQLADLAAQRLAPSRPTDRDASLSPTARWSG
jgi:DNA-binding NtrC family response regulator